MSNRFASLTDNDLTIEQIKEQYQQLHRHFIYAIDRCPVCNNKVLVYKINKELTTYIKNTELNEFVEEMSNQPYETCCGQPYYWDYFNWDQTVEKLWPNMYCGLLSKQRYKMLLKEWTKIRQEESDRDYYTIHDNQMGLSYEVFDEIVKRKGYEWYYYNFEYPCDEEQYADYTDNIIYHGTPRK